MKSAWCVGIAGKRRAISRPLLLAPLPLSCPKGAMQCQSLTSCTSASCSGRLVLRRDIQVIRQPCYTYLPCKALKRQNPRGRRSYGHSQSPSHPAEGEEEEEFEGLTEEEDWEVPGTSNDSLSSNTQLGRAVQDACRELEGLQALEQATLSEAEHLLKRLGYRGSLTQGGDSNTVKRLDQTSLTVHAR